MCVNKDNTIIHSQDEFRCMIKIYEEDDKESISKGFKNCILMIWRRGRECKPWMQRYLFGYQLLKGIQ